jgi:hypothetical protein
VLAADAAAQAVGLRVGMPASKAQALVQAAFGGGDNGYGKRLGPSDP